VNDKRKAKKRKVEGEDPLSDWPVWADQPEYDKRYYMDKVNGLHIKLRVIKWEIYLDQNGVIGQLIETLPTQSYTYEQARQWCREYKESAAKIAAKTVRLDTFKPPLSEKVMTWYSTLKRALKQEGEFAQSEPPKPDDVTQEEWDAVEDKADYMIFKKADEEFWARLKLSRGEWTGDEFLAWGKKRKQAEDEAWKPFRKKLEKKWAAQIEVGETQRVALSEKEKEKYRSADEKLRQSDWFQLSKQEQADWDRGADYETQKYIEEAEKERKIRIDAQKPWLFVITLFGFIFLGILVIADLSLLMQFVLGWLLLIGLIYTLMRIHDM